MLELLVVLGLITVLIGLALAGASTLRKRSQSVSCISNLRQIGGAFTQYALMNNRFFPPPNSLKTSPSWELTLSGSFIDNPDVFHCPADEVVYPYVGSSYDWRDTGDPSTTLAGTAITDTTRGGFVLASEATANFHAKGKINVVFIDGSAGEMDSVACFKDTMLPIRNASVLGSGPILSGN